VLADGLAGTGGAGRTGTKAGVDTGGVTGRGLVLVDSEFPKSASANRKRVTIRELNYTFYQCSQPCLPQRGRLVTQ